MKNIPGALQASWDLKKWKMFDDGDTYAEGQLKLAALEYAAIVFEHLFGKLLDGGELHDKAMPVIRDILQVARARPESLP